MTNIDLKRGVDFTGVSVAMYLHDDAGRLLMHKRSAKCRDEQGKWDTGAGALEFGETFEEGIAREAREEYGATISDMRFHGATTALRENDGIKTHWVIILLSALVNPSQVKINEPEKMDHIGWFYVDDLPTPLHSQIPSDLDVILNSEKNPFVRKNSGV